MSLDHDNDIAIVGMAGLYPKAPDIDGLWQNILAKVDAVTEATPEWLASNRILDPESNELRRIYTAYGGFLGDLARFDASRFGTMPTSVEGAQPDQFLALALASDALVDAGCTPGDFDGRTTGVILGHSIHMHRANVNGVLQIWQMEQTRELLHGLFPEAGDDQLDQAIERLGAGLPKISPESLPGLVPNVMTGRIANRLDLMGPNYVIDAACASSLIAVDLAMTELRSGRADMMLAGGVNTTTSPLVYSVFCNVGALSRGSRIRPFDAGADGTILGEGAGILVLKRLADARKSGDRVYAVIKGVGQSSDGKSSGLMAPRLEGEVLAIERAYEQTGIDPATVGLIEAHGTGIPLGDRTEIEALRRVFGGRRHAYPDVAIGSLKSMIGHCIPASGTASMIKCALALHNKVVPPMLCDEVSEDIAIADTPFYVSNETRPWINGGLSPRRAAIDAFGFGGINSHLIMEEAPDSGGQGDPTAAFVRFGRPAEQVAFFGASDRAGLLADVRKMKAEISADAAPGLVDLLAHQSNPGDSTPCRLAIIAADRDDLAQRLTKAEAILADPATRRVATRSGIYFADAAIGGKVAFMFPGEMAQYPGMLADAATAYPEVREWFDFLDALFADRRAERHSHLIFQPPTGLDEAATAALTEKLRQVDFGSEAVFAADQAMLAMLRRLGIEADCYVGHSTGENAALVGAGVFDMTRAEVGGQIRRMNEIFDQTLSSGAVPEGVLLNIAGLDRARLASVLDRHRDIHFTMDNCPNQAIVFAGDEVAAGLEAELVDGGAIVTRLPISWAYHTRYVEPMAAAFAELFDPARLRPEAAKKLYSCATAAPFPGDDRDIFRDTVRRQYTSRVRFSETIEQMYADGCRTFIEVGPNNLLTSFVRDILQDREHLAVSSDHARRGTVSQLRHLAAQLFVAGIPLDLGALPESRPAAPAIGPAPALASELPFISLDVEEAAGLRELLGAGARKSIKAPDRASRVTGIVANRQHPKPVPQRAEVTSRGTTAVSAHFALMNDFLRRQERIGLAVPTPRGRRNAPRNGTSGVRFHDMTRLFEAPFSMSAVLATGAAVSSDVRGHLSDEELAMALALEAEPGRKRARQWLLGRLAVKRAVQKMLEQGRGLRVGGRQIRVSSEASGKPTIDLAGIAQSAPEVSISHVGDLALGVAGHPEWRVGIDVEEPGRVRDPGEFIASLLSPEEAAIVRTDREKPLDRAAVRAWCIKEAAAKSVGRGLLGEPQKFRIASLSPDAARATVTVAGQSISVEVRELEGLTCTLAYWPVN